MTRGRLISFEGGEGAGKSTLIKHLAAFLEASGKRVVCTREPGGTPGAEAIRALLVTGETGRWDPMTEALLHVAARRDHVGKLIEPALACGTWVLTDRFADSTMAYQGYGHELGREAVELLHEVALGGMMPDLTILLDLPPAAGLARAGRRASPEDRYERMDTAFHERVRDGFLDIARREPERVACVDSTGELEAVAAEIRALATSRFGLEPGAEQRHG